MPNKRLKQEFPRVLQRMSSSARYHKNASPVPWRPWSNSFFPTLLNRIVDCLISSHRLNRWLRVKWSQEELPHLTNLLQIFFQVTAVLWCKMSSSVISACISGSHLYRVPAATQECSEVTCIKKGRAKHLRLLLCGQCRHRLGPACLWCLHV